MTEQQRDLKREYQRPLFEDLERERMIRARRLNPPGSPNEVEDSKNRVIRMQALKNEQDDMSKFQSFNDYAREVNKLVQEGMTQEPLFSYKLMPLQKENNMNTPKMKWINPREELPNDGQLVWGLKIRNRAGKGNGLPCAYMEIYKSCLDEYGVITLRGISINGAHSFSEYTSMYFTEWDHEVSVENLLKQNYVRGFQNLVCAWMPYVECLPDFDFLNIKESKDLILNDASYRQALAKKKTEEALEECTNKNTKFLSLKQYKPTKNGLYVVATKSSVVVAKYDENTCNPWILPNGEGVFAWYPLPESI